MRAPNPLYFDASSTDAGSGRTPASIKALLASIVFLLSLFVAPALSALDSIDNADSIVLPQDLSKVHFYLITVDVGNRVWDNFGHTALRMVDENNHTDRVFNWGYFDPSGGPVLFAFDFFKGIMNYTMVASAPEWEFAQYRQQRRTVWQDKINLNNQQKATLYKRLVWNSQPENLVYSYQYFFDNCTTKVRDYLDEALAGKISSSYSGASDVSYRNYVRSHYASIGLIGFSLDILMNSNIDRQVSEWESMFLPLQLRDKLAFITSDVADTEGRLQLLSNSEVVGRYKRPSPQANPYDVAALVLLAPVVLLWLLITKQAASYYSTHAGVGLRMPGLSFRVLAVLALLTSVFSGIYGTLMLSSWFFSDHVDLHHNINLLLFWPTDILGFVVGLRWLFLCKPWPLTHNNAPFIKNYLLVHLLGMLIYSVVGLLGLTDQTTQSIIYYVVPGFFLFTLLVWFVGFQPAKPKSSFY